jgi:hypothetical protein
MSVESFRGIMPNKQGFRYHVRSRYGVFRRSSAVEGPLSLRVERYHEHSKCSSAA